MPLSAVHQSFEQFGLPVVIIGGGALVYANPAWSRFTGLEVGAWLGRTVEEVIGAAVGVPDRSWLGELHAQHARGQALPEELWVQIRAPDGQSRFAHVHWSPGPGEGEDTFVLFAADAEAASRQVTDALIRNATHLFGLREERAVLQSACAVLFELGLFVGFLVLDGERLTQVISRQDPELVAEVWRLGIEPEQLTYRIAEVSHWVELFETRRAFFNQDVYPAVRRVIPPKIVEVLVRRFPAMKGVDAPVFVDGEPYGILSVQALSMSPSAAAAIELFAGAIGGAIGNVRHHQLAKARLCQLEQLQTELVQRERLAVVGEAAAVLAHEVRNPIGAIRNVAALLSRPHSEQTISTLVTMLEEESQRLDDLVRSLLDFARPLTPRFERVNLTRVSPFRRHV
jgi:two-component system, NtrC family, sensor histidine kinase HydH